MTTHNVHRGTILSTIAALASTGAAVAAWLAAKRSNATAEAVARIERDRWQADLTPQFDITLTESSHGQGLLNVHLNGPDHLRHLDEVIIALGNNDMDHTLTHPEPNVTQEDYDNFVWGPFRFRPHVNGTDEHGRSPEPFPLVIGTGRPLAMDRTDRGHWMTGTSQEAWQLQNAGESIRLELTCRRGDEEWVIARRLDNPPAATRT
jgi:hypothetical protein